MPLPDAALDVYRRRITVVRDRASASLVRAWKRLDRYDEDDIPAFTQATATDLAAAKAAAVSLSAAFFAVALRTRPVGVTPQQIDVDPYLRGPFLAVWHALKEGRPYDEAVAAGEAFSQAVGFDYVQHVARRTGDHVAEQSGVEIRWRRAPTSSSCAWCQNLAAGNTWPTAEAADFGHERCDCDVVPT